YPWPADMFGFPSGFPQGRRVGDARRVRRPGAGSGVGSGGLGAEQFGQASAEVVGRAGLALGRAAQRLLEGLAVAELRVAALADLEVSADRLGGLGRELAVEVLVEAGDGFAAGGPVHGSRPAIASPGPRAPQR